MKEQEDVFMKVLDATECGDIVTLDDILVQKNLLNILYISIKEKWNWLHLCNINSYSPAALSSIKFYIQHGVPVNAQDIYGMTPLHYAMRSKNAEAALALLEAGADPNIPNIDSVIPLSMIGGMPERLDVLKLMLEKGGNVHYFNGQHQVLEGLKKYCGDKPKFIPVIELMEKYA